MAICAMKEIVHKARGSSVMEGRKGYLQRRSGEASPRRRLGREGAGRGWLQGVSTPGRASTKALGQEGVCCIGG